MDEQKNNYMNTKTTMTPEETVPQKKVSRWDVQIRWGITAFLVLAAATGLGYLLCNMPNLSKAVERLMTILTPIIYGAVMAYLTAPIYNFALKHTYRFFNSAFHSPKVARNLSRFLATLTCLSLLLVVGIGLIALIIPQLYSSIMSLINSFPQEMSAGYERLMKMLSDNPEASEFAEKAYDYIYSSVTNYAENTLLPNTQKIVTGLSSGIWSAITVLKNLVIGLIVMVYLLNMKRTLLGQTRKLVYAIFPSDWANEILAEANLVDKMFGGFIIGKLLDSAIIGILCYIVLYFMEMPYALLVSIIVGITNIIPFFGPFIGAIPGFILILLVDPLKSMYFLIFILILQQFDGNILGPKILGDSTGLSSFWVLFSILLFGGVFGFVGMIIGVPLFAVILDLLRRLCARSLSKKRISLNSADYLTEKEKEQEWFN